MWLLLTGTALVSGLLLLANRTAEDFALVEHETRRELAQESAAELVIHDIVSRGARSHWLSAPRVMETITVDEQKIALSVQNVDGLIDVGTGDLDLIDVVLSRAVRREAHAIGAAIRAVRQAHDGAGRVFSSYAELQALSGASPHAFACLHPYATLFSGKSMPTPLFAPSNLVQLLGLDGSDAARSSALEPATVVAGSTYRIEASPAATDSVAGQILSIEVTITGQIRPSHLIRSWQYRMRATPEGDCAS